MTGMMAAAMTSWGVRREIRRLRRVNTMVSERNDRRRGARMAVRVVALSKDVAVMVRLLRP
jgi:hypothetical protein